MKQYVNYVPAALAVAILVLAGLFLKQGTALDAALEAASSHPANVEITVTNNGTNQQVTLACTSGADVEGVSDYSMSVKADGKKGEAKYGCSHVKADVLSPPSTDK